MPGVSRLFEYLMAMKYTAKQGQYLAFIYYYTKIHRRAPAESDLQEYFRVSPPSVHQMILNLEKEGFIERVPGQGVLSSCCLDVISCRIWSNSLVCEVRFIASHFSIHKTSQA